MIKVLQERTLQSAYEKANAMLLLSNEVNDPPSLKTCCQIVRCLGISADKLFYPEATLDENSATREITRMAATCTSKQLWFY